MDWTRFEEQFDDWKGRKFRWQQMFEDRLFATDEVVFDHCFHSFYHEIVWSHKEEFKEPNEMNSNKNDYLYM